MFDCMAFSFDLHKRDRVKPLELLISFRVKLSGIRRILLNLIDDHVKHVFEHIKLRCDHVNLAENFRAQARSSCARSRT